MSETTVVDARLDKLEQDNRRLKLATGALLLVLAAAPLVGAMMPQQIPDVVRARRCVVYDESDKIRTTINEHGVAYADENGNPRAMISPLGIVYWDENFNEVWCAPDC